MKILQDSYSKTIKKLYDLQQFSVKQGLENIQQLSQFLNNPEKKYPVLHVAGTNGKGSTSVMLQKILFAHGLRTGLYTSPHLLDFRERIRINDDFIDRNYIVGYWKNIDPLVSRIKATFFDTTTALAFNYFHDHQVDVAVIETGLGGRLDSTNIVDSAAAIITPIHRDHTKQLGIKLRAITTEKADIIKNSSTVFCGKQHYQVYRALRPYHRKAPAWYYLTKSLKMNVHKSTTIHSEFTLTDFVNGTKISNIRLNLAGRHQIDNAALAYMTSRWYLGKINVKFDEKKFRNALVEVQWPGRFQVMSNKPEVIFDVSHNFDGFRQTLKIIRNNYPKEKSHLLLGLLDDKEYKSIAKLIGDHFKSVIITEPGHERPLPAEKIKNVLDKAAVEIKIIKNDIEAFEYAYHNIGKKDTLFVMGSHFLIGALTRAISKRT
jgi:dihydrofolate synthase/folylpolyglutamate synthase